MKIAFVDAENADLLSLTHKLDEYYYEIVGEVQRRYEMYNNPQMFACRAVAYRDEKAVGCGCWKALDADTAEMKRIYVLPEFRRQGIASELIRRLEQDATVRGYSRAILETARTTKDSETLYLGLGYHKIPYYGSPAGEKNCLCFEKRLQDAPQIELKFVDVTNAELLRLAAEMRNEACVSGDAACAIVAYADGKAVGCGCWRAYDPVSAEIVSLYACEAYRGRAVLESVIQALEEHAATVGCHRTILRANAAQTDAIAFYEKQGYKVVPNAENCVWLEKEVSDGTMR